MPFTVEDSAPARRARDTVALLRKETLSRLICGHRTHPT